MCGQYQLTHGPVEVYSPGVEDRWPIAPSGSKCCFNPTRGLYEGEKSAPCPMCEMASSCLCVVALATASGSCSGNGSTSLQTRQWQKMYFQGC